MKFLHHHKRTLIFPFIFVGLSVALILFMVYAFTGEEKVDQSGEFQEQEIAVTDDDYRAEISKVVGDFLERREATGSDLERLVLVEETLDGVLALKVSAAYKDLHLELASSLYQISEGLRGEAGALDQGEERFDRAVSSNPWLR